MKAWTFLVSIIGLYSNIAIECYGNTRSDVSPSDDFVDIESVLGDLLTRSIAPPAIDQTHDDEILGNNSNTQRRAVCNDPSCGSREEIITKHGQKSFLIYTDIPVGQGILDTTTRRLDEGTSGASLYSKSGNPVGYVQTACQEMTVFSGSTTTTPETSDDSVCSITLKFVNPAGFEIGSLYLQGIVFTGEVGVFTDKLAVKGGSGCFAGAVGSVIREYSPTPYNYNVGPAGPRFDVCWKFTLYEYWKHEYYWLLQ